MKMGIDSKIQVNAQDGVEESVCSQAAPRELYVGIDVGSTTVKLVALDVQSQECVPLISRYVRHGARQAETAAKLLEELAQTFLKALFMQHLRALELRGLQKHCSFPLFRKLLRTP